MIRKAIKSDLESLDSLSVKTIKSMNAQGIPQWNLTYPRKKHFENDILMDTLYVATHQHQVVAVMALMDENEEAYKIINWQRDNAMVVHRILVDPDFQQCGFGRELLMFAIRTTAQRHKDSLKIDTLPTNYKMQKLLHSLNFKYQGYLTNINRDAFELVLDKLSNNEK